MHPLGFSNFKGGPVLGTIKPLSLRKAAAACIVSRSIGRL